MIQIKPTGIDGIYTEEQIAYIVDNTTEVVDKYVENEAYFSGNNPTILTKTAPTNSNFPDNKIPVPYGRKLSLTTANYMFNTDVMYNAIDEDYLETLREILFINSNNQKIDTLGLDLIIHGVSYKLFYFPEGKGDIPYYAIISGNEIIPLYDLAIEPKLNAVIRHYTQVDPLDNTKTKTIAEVYYKTKFMKYEQMGTTLNASMDLVEDTLHGFTTIPVVVYGDNYQLGVFDAVKKIIDGIDTIISSDLNEVEKFALAYLVITGSDIKQEELDKVVENRLFQLPDKEATLNYLTKNINNDFNNDVLAFLVAEVHKQSGIPDFASAEFAAISGIALQYKLMGFENIAASIEGIFKKGEQDSIDIINNAVYNSEDRFEFIKANPDSVVKITLSRNIPEDVISKIEVAKGMTEVGLSKESIIDYIPIIEDTTEELERIVKETAENQKRFDESFQEPEDDSVEEEEEDE